jgi:hypothetical protein
LGRRIRSELLRRMILEAGALEPLGRRAGLKAPRCETCIKTSTAPEGGAVDLRSKKHRSGLLHAEFIQLFLGLLRPFGCIIHLCRFLEIRDRQVLLLHGQVGQPAIVVHF